MTRQPTSSPFFFFFWGGKGKHWQTFLGGCKGGAGQGFSAGGPNLWLCHWIQKAKFWQRSEISSQSNFKITNSLQYSKFQFQITPKTITRLTTPSSQLPHPSLFPLDPPSHRQHQTPNQTNMVHCYSAVLWVTCNHGQLTDPLSYAPLRIDQSQRNEGPTNKHTHGTRSRVVHKGIGEAWRGARVLAHTCVVGGA